MEKKFRVVFFGTPDFATTTLRALTASGFCDLVGVVTTPDKPVGRKQELTPPPVKTVALELGLPILQPASLKSPTAEISVDRRKSYQELVDSLRKMEADLFVVIAYGKIIPQKILDIPKFGCLNIHYSLLPKYRGAAPVQFALLNGERETGVTIMKLDSEMDHGPIIKMQSMSIKDNETAGTLFDRLTELGNEMLIEVIPKYISGEIEPVEQDHNQATYTKMIKKEDGLVDFTQKTAQEIINTWRAFTPWPGIHSKFKVKEGLLIKLLKIKIFDGEYKNKGVSASNFLVENKKLLVSCKSGTWLEILELQVEGKKAMSVESFINGYLK